MIQGRLMDRPFGNTRIPGISRLVSDRREEVVARSCFFGTPIKLCGDKKRFKKEVGRHHNNYYLSCLSLFLNSCQEIDAARSKI